MSNSYLDSGQENLFPVGNSDSDNHAEETTVDKRNSNSEASTSSDRQQNRKILLQKLKYKMYSILKEVVLFLLCAITYAALTNDPPKISKSPAAYPFFPKDSMVVDWYRGQMNLAIETTRKSDIAFIMFYAPWDAECQKIRFEFDLASRYMHKQITFAAINCWQPGSECRNHYNKAYNWPVLIVYTSFGRGIQYKGARTAPHFIQFLRAVQRPLLRIYSQKDVVTLLSSYDAVVVGVVNAFSIEYSVLYSAALRYLDRDPYQEIAFAVLTSHEEPSVRLHMWNETLIYPSDMEWKANSLLNWIFKSLHQVTLWFTPSGSKSVALSNYILPGPALMLFTPKNPLEQSRDLYDMLYEISSEYYNCEDQWFVRSNQAMTRNTRKINYVNYRNLIKSCSNQSSDNVPFLPTVTYTLPPQWINNSCCASSGTKSDTCSKCDPIEMIRERFPQQCDSDGEYKECREDDHHTIFFGNRGRKQVAEELVDGQGTTCKDKKYKTSEIVGADDPLSPANLRKWWKEENCRMAHIAQKVHQKVFSKSLYTSSFEEKINISGLACKTNASLTLIALDSLLYYHFAERLGLDLLNRKDKTAAIIVNDKMESHYVLEKPVDDQSVRSFIFNFTHNKLTRAKVSTSSFKQLKSHAYQRKICQPSNSGQFCVEELDSETFLSTILQEHKAVIVLYHSKQCSFCNGISYSFLTTAKIFSPVRSLLFTRIDGDLNTLPWEYTMDSYPTILFLPLEKKSESRVFPRAMPVTVQNLINFVLANLESNLKLHAMWSICTQTKVEKEKQACISTVRIETLSLINRTLKKWRQSSIQLKARLLYKLDQLRTLNLLLAHSPDDTDYIQTMLVKLYTDDMDEI